jgi:hypothetical protein
LIFSPKPPTNVGNLDSHKAIDLPRAIKALIWDRHAMIGVPLKAGALLKRS